jgi:hypothetical protein
MQHLRPVLPAAPPCCPRYQATEAIASGARSVKGPLVVQDAACIILE